jgi:hypothetical protein
MAKLLVVAIAASIFGLLASWVMNWASGKSPLWNIGFGVVIVLVGAVVLLLGVLGVIQLLASR